MVTTSKNPFDTQQPKATDTGILGGSMTQQPTTSGQLPSNVGTSAPATPNVATFAPTTHQVNAPTETAQGQLSSILAKDNPLMQRARTQATQSMAQRGLVNSSMAQGAAVAAMIDRATPIAQQDAGTFNQVASENQNALNQSGQFNAAEINRFGLQKGEQQFAAEQAGINREFQTGERIGSQAFASSLETAKQNFTSAQAQLDRAQQVALSDKSIEAQQALQAAQQNFQGAQSALDRTQQTTLQRDQQGFVAGQSNLDRAQQLSVANMNIQAESARQTSQQAFQGSQAAMDRGQQTALQVSQQQFQTTQAQIQNDFTMRVQQLQEAGQDFRQARDVASREAMVRLEQAGVNNRFDREIALKSSQFNIEQNNLERRQIQQNQAELDRLGLQIRAENARVPTQFAANVSNTTMQGVSAIYGQPMDANGKPTAAERQAQVQSVVNYANNQIAWAERFYSTSIPRIS
jgi:hypothetical protein